MLVGESNKMNYDSGFSSGPPGGMFSNSKLWYRVISPCCILTNKAPYVENFSK